MLKSELVLQLRWALNPRQGQHHYLPFSAPPFLDNDYKFAGLSSRQFHVIQPTTRKQQTQPCEDKTWRLRTRHWAHSLCHLAATRDMEVHALQATAPHERLLTHGRNTKIRVISTDVVIRQIKKAYLPCSASSSRHRQCQHPLTPMAQDADNECHALETLQILTDDKKDRETKNNICLHRL